MTCVAGNDYITPGNCGSGNSAVVGARASHGGRHTEINGFVLFGERQNLESPQILEEVCEQGVSGSRGFARCLSVADKVERSAEDFFQADYADPDV